MPQLKSSGQGASSILLVSEPGVDGVFHYVKNLTDFLLRNGWRVHLAYSSQRGCPALFDLVAQVRDAGGETLDLRVGNAPRPADARALARLWSLARRVKPDLVHAHSSKAGVLVRALPLLGVKTPCFYTSHAYYLMSQPMTARKWFFTTVERVFGRVGTTICVSGSDADYARRIIGVPPEKLCAVTAGTDCDRFRPADGPAEKAAARSRFGLPPDVLLLGTVARYSEQKDPLTLYRALLASLAHHPALHFAHLGKGELGTAVDDLLVGVSPEVRSRIHRIAGSDDPASFYRSLDAFTLPSRYEGFALSVMEAAASGLPLIVSDCPGNADLKELPLDSVRWTTVGDPASLTHQIDLWSANPAQRNNHRQVALEHLNADVSLEAILKCYAAHR